MIDILRTVIDPALSRLPAEMTSDAARAMLIAIGLQESGLHYRKQVRGPAMGLWQFERIGVAEVMRNLETRDAAIDLCWQCGVAGTTAAVYNMLDTDDILAAGIARLALWRHPDTLPGRDEAAKGWIQYAAIWAPGKPRREVWDDYFLTAWRMVEAA